LFATDARFPELNVAGSIMVSRAKPSTASPFRMESRSVFTSQIKINALYLALVDRIGSSLAETSHQPPV
jgi:hypothetical protein